MQTKESAIERLLSTWTPSHGNGYAEAAVWDASAHEFDSHPIPSWDNDAFLAFMAKDMPAFDNASVLDIGCGTGVYSIALADKAKHVTGIDISANMVRFAREKAREHGVETTTTFEQGDFRTTDFEEPFDIVIAHLTPAVADGRTFGKMMGLARHYCALAKPTRRTDSVLDALKTLIGIETSGDRMDEDFLKAFAAVWLSGKNPHVASYPDEWHSSRSLDEAFTLYGNRLIVDELGSEQRASMRAYLEGIAVDGMVEETIVTTIMMMSWHT